MAISTTGTSSPFPTTDTVSASANGFAAPLSAGMGGNGGTAQQPSELVDRVVQGAHATIDRLAEHAKPAVQRLQDGVSGANEMLHTRADQVREIGDEWAESLRCTVRENPLASVAAALAVGLLVARLTR